MCNLLSYKRTKMEGFYISLLIVFIFLNVGLPMLAYARDTIKSSESLPQPISNLAYEPFSNIDYVNAINDKCPSDTFAKVIVLANGDEFYSIIDKFIKKDGEYFSPDYWVNFEKGTSYIDKYTKQWIPKEGEKKGILFFLLPGQYHVLNEVLDYFVSFADNPLTGPRLGICTLDQGQDQSICTLDQGQDQKLLAELRLVGTNSTLDSAPSNSESLKPPLYISMAQVELYNININANDVDPNVSAIELKNGGKLLLNNVTFTREGKSIKKNLAGLVDSNGSYLGMTNSVLKQETDVGVMVNSHQGVLDCKNSDLSVNPDVPMFIGATNKITLSACHFNSLAQPDASAKPIFFYDDFADDSANEDCGFKNYDYCKRSPDPSNDLPPIGREVCSQLISICDSKANQFTMNDNLFTGNWNSIFHSSWSSFVEQSNNKFASDAHGNKLGRYFFCATPDSFSVHGTLYFDDHICVKPAMW
ncbi:MAG: hypothetical protein HAW66_07575 [Shewanella sp.]|nr:hypothetical protein [Shewanella sp.]